MVHTPQRDRRSYLSALCRAVPYHIVEAVLDSPLERALEPQTFVGSVLVIDLVGFTPMCEAMAAGGPAGLSSLHVLLDRFFEWLELQAVFPYRGYVVQFAGDAVLVVFRGPDHARRCTACALTIRRLVHDAEREEVLGAHGHDLMVRMGLALGQVRLQVLGDMARRLSVCAGEAIHRAIRHQQEAEPGEIKADAGLYQALSGRIEVRASQVDCVVPVSLLSWPDKVPIEPLEPRLESAVEEKIALLEPFVPPPLARRMRSTLEGWRIQGEIRHATVLFADVQGFEESPDHLQLARDVARSVLRAFRKYDGVVLNMAATAEGHRALLLYGLHNPSENDVERALLAALESCGRMMAFSRPTGMPLSMRLGVHTGDVYLGSIGSSYKHDLTAVGDVVNVAARVAQSAEPNQVVATESALREVGHEFDLTTGCPLRVKGKSAPLAVQVVHGPADGRSRYLKKRGAGRFLAGREEQIGTLFELVDAAMAGHGSVVLITGEAGTGKSALLGKAIDRWIDGGGIGVIGRCRFATRSSPLAPVVDMFSAYFGITEGDSDEQRATMIRAGLADCGLQQGLQELMTLLQPVRRPDGLVEALVDLAEGPNQQRVTQAVLRFIRHRVQQRKVMYVLEDMHLADTLTLQLFQHVKALPRDQSFLFVCTCRPDDSLGDLRARVDREIVVGNLDAGQSARLVCNELDARSVDPGLADFLWRRTGGNPEFLVQIVRFLADRFLIHVKAGKVGVCEPGMPLLEDVVPRTWAHVVLARLEGLGEVERRILRVASAIGRRFGTDVLERASGLRLEPDLLDTAMSILEHQQLIAAEHGDRPQFRFRDDITRAIAYAMIPEGERRDLHRRIADALDREHATSARALAAALGHHREQAGQWREAARWYEEVTRMSAHTGMDREARYFADRWSSVVDHLPPHERPGPDSAVRVALARLVATARQHWSRAAFGQARRILQAHADKLDGRSRWLVERILGEAHFWLGWPAEARRRLEHVYHAAGGEADIRFDSACLVARLHVLGWEFEPAGAWLRRAERLVGDDDHRRTSLDRLQGGLHLERGEMEQAAECLQRAAKRAEAHGHIPLQAACWRDLARQALLSDQMDIARNRLGSALELDRRMRSAHGEASDLFLEGVCALRSRELEEAARLIEPALGTAREVGDEILRASALIHLGTVVAMTRDPREGMDMHREGRRLAAKYNLRGHLRESALDRMQLALARGDPAGFNGALDEYHQAGGETGCPLHHRLLTEALTAREEHEKSG